MGSQTYGYLVAFAAAIGGLLFGYEIGVVSQVLAMPSFGLFFELLVWQNVSSPAYNKDDCTKFNDTTALCPSPNHGSNTGLITFTFLIGCAAGAIIVSMLADWWGRKKCVIASGFGFLIGGAIQSASASAGMLYVGRVISGVAIGILSMVVPLYISEAAPTEIRGRMIAIQQLMITIGIVIASLVNTAIILSYGSKNLDNTEWRVALAIQCLPALGLSLVMMFMPESPRWLAEKGRDDESLVVIAKLRSAPASDEGVVEEFKEIIDGVQFERAVGNGSWSELFTKGLSNRVALTVVMQFFQQWTGINVILYYQADLLRGMGLDPDAANIPFTIANNVVNCFATLPGMYLIEKLGRRPLLLFGGIFMGTAHFLVCLFINLSKANQTHNALGEVVQTGASTAFSYLAVFSVYIFLFSFGSTWGPIAWVYQSEIFPLRVRAKGTGLSTLSNWVNNAIIALVIPIVQEALAPNKQQMYLIFGTTGLMMASFIYFFVPETMGRSLEDMDELFGAPEGMSRAEFELSQGKNYKPRVMGGH